MARMLQKDSWRFLSCCSHCDRKKKRNKTGRRERRAARAGEAQAWRREADREL